MSISRKDVQHIANLARIELNAEEEVQFEKDLSGILEFVDTLNKVDTTNVDPMDGGTTLQNSMRQDSQVSEDLEGKSANLIAAVPEKKENWVKVRSVFE